jgi:hypothetical protein
MFRVGKDRQAEAMAIAGAGPMAMGRRTMGGIVNVRDEALADDKRRRAWMLLALANAASLILALPASLPRGTWRARARVPSTVTTLRSSS